MERSEIAKLVQLAKQDDEQARSDLCNLAYDSGYFIAYKITRNQDDALDIVQDAFVKAFTSLDQLEKEGSFVSWFHCIVSNRAKDYVKKRKPTLFVEMRDKDSDAELDFADEDITFQPDQNLDYRETQKLVERIVDSLPEDQRLCVLMYYYDEQPVAQIAQALEISENTVKSRLLYARKKIKGMVLDLEEKEGIRLHGVAPLPLFVWLLRGLSEESPLPADIGSALVEKVLAATQGSAAAGAAGQAAGAAAAKAVSAKAVAGIVAGAVAVTGITASIAWYRRPAEAPVSALVDVMEPVEQEAALEEDCEDDSPPIDFLGGGTFVYEFAGYSLELPAAWGGYVAFQEEQRGNGRATATAFYIPCNDIHREDSDGRGVLFQLEAVSRERYGEGNGAGQAIGENDQTVLIYTDGRAIHPDADRSGLSESYWGICDAADQVFSPSLD